MSDTFYSILGLPETATKDEIKKAYRSLQMKYHPDKNPNNPEAFKMTQKINEAYETLGDEQKRTEYDMMRKGMPRPFGGGGGMDVPMDDIFNMFFGGGMGGGNPFTDMGMGIGGMPPNAKIHIFHGGPGPMGFQQAMNKPVPIIKTLSVSLEQVLSGASIPLEIERWIVENGTKVFEKETIYVDVPCGIDENEMIILRDRGNIINEHCKGDVKVNIAIQNNTMFKRNGLDLIVEKHVSLKESLCGFKFELKHINGKSYTINNNKGNIIPPDYHKIYHGMGLKRGDHVGNLIIRFMVDFPYHLSDEQIDTLIKVL